MIYNNPALGQAFGNLAAAFAPPSGSDLHGYANAAATREQAARLAQLFAGGASPSEQAALIGVQNFGQTPEGFRFDVNTRSGDNRYATDVGAETALATNAADNERAILTNTQDNQRAAITSLYGALNEGQIAPAVPQEIMDALGLPALEERQGLPARGPSETEVLGAILEGMDPEMQIARAFGSTPLEQVVGDDGTARYATRPDAIGQVPAATGQEGARKDAVAVINGQTVPVTRAPNDLQWRTADGQPIPPDAQVFSLPAPTGSAEDVGMTTATASGVQGRLIATQQTLSTAQRLLDTIRSNPSSQGVAGMLRGTAQDVIQTGGELGQLLGGGVAEVSNAINNGMAEAGIGAEFFDPSIPAIDMLTNLLAWQYAKSLSGERVSNEQLRQARSAIGGENLFSNQANSEARLTTLIDMLQGQQAELQSLMPGFGIAPSGGSSAGPTPPAPPQPPQPPSPPTGGQSSIPAIASDAEYDALPSGARFYDPEGNLREKP